MSPATAISVRTLVPSIDTYCFLRRSCGLSPMSEAAAQRGLPNSLFAVQLFDGETPIGMGRVIGDGGCFYQVCDICVLPAYQGRGLGKRIMGEISAWLEQNLADSSYVSLLADGEAQHLYAQFGFVPTAPRSIGMALRRKR